MAARGSGQKLQRSSSGGRQTNQPLCRYLRGSAISALGESRSRRVVLLFLSRSGRAYNDLSAQTYQDLTRRASSGESRVPSPAFLPPTAFFFLSQPLRVALLPGSSSSYHLCIGYDTATRRLRTQRRDFEIDFEAAAQRSERRSRLALLLYPARSLLYFQHAVSSFTFSLRSTQLTPSRSLTTDSSMASLLSIAMLALSLSPLPANAASTITKAAVAAAATASPLPLTEYSYAYADIVRPQFSVCKDRVPS